MGFEEQFDLAQWRILRLAPFLVLSGVSGRYRGFAAEELLVFERWLDEAGRAAGLLNRAVLTSVLADLPGVAADYDRYDGTIVGGLTAVSEVLAGQPPEEVGCFRHALVHVLGAGLARARGPYGRHPTVESAQMLTLLEEFLRPGVAFPRKAGAA